DLIPPLPQSGWWTSRAPVTCEEHSPVLIWRKTSQSGSLLHFGQSLGSEKRNTTLRSCAKQSICDVIHLLLADIENEAPVHFLSFRPSLRGVLIFFLCLIGGACLLLSIINDFNMGFFLGAAAAFIALAIHDKLSGA
ncbi:unnamed protein product, partial [Clonostachys rhizophaga]